MEKSRPKGGAGPSPGGRKPNAGHKSPHRPHQKRNGGGGGGGFKAGGGKPGGKPGGGHNKQRNQQKQQPQQQQPSKSSGAAEDAEIAALRERYASIDVGAVRHFTDLPLSKKTLRGLKAAGYTVPTAIQRESIGHALQGRDVLGAAITGSGKTLAFIIPVLEALYARKWSRPDGVGAIIITPTRELAYQIFETLKKVGGAHDFSAGLIIGGKNLKFERSRMDQCNIVICTPGRLLHHMDQNQVFNCSSMQILVLDEADRCLDMGFEQDMNAIIEHLPPERQTFLYSATQTSSVKDLARLSLNSPVFVAPHEQSAFSTPDALAQNYVVVALEDKITMLWSFVKTHLKQKCIVFMSSCKQVKYVYEMFCKLRPGCSLLALYGTLHQDRRMAIYNEFCRKSSVVLFATDIAARGLDFPTVNWVVQLDCPEDATTYIHRAGRTARNAKHGESLLVLLPSEEEAMVAQLLERKIPIQKIAIDPRRLFSPRLKMEGFLAQSQELKESAQRAFVAYVKSVVLMKDKRVFRVEELNTDAFALSLGLVVVPRIRFLQRQEKQRAANREKQLAENGGKKKEKKVKKEEKTKKKKESDDSDSEEATEEAESSDSEEEEDDSGDDENDPKPAPSAAKPKLPTSTQAFNAHFDDTDSEDSDSAGFMTIKRRDHEIPEDSLPVVPSLEEERARNKKPLTKAALAKRVIRKGISANSKVVFDEEGAQRVDTAKQLQSEMAAEYERDAEGGIDIEQAKRLLREEDKFDKERFKQMVKLRHKDAKKKGKTAGDQEQFDEFGSDGEVSDGPDLSWLPDPDKIYGKQKGSDEEDDDDSGDDSVDYSGSDDDDDDDDGPRSNRFQRQVVNSSDESSDEEQEELVHKPGKLVTASRKGGKNGQRRARSSDDDEDGDDGAEDAPPPQKRVKKLTNKLSLNEAEAMAMAMLSGGI